MIEIQQVLDIIVNKKTHCFYKDSCDMAFNLSVHADGEIPTELLRQRRPRESKEILEYREKIYISKTEAPVFKVMNSLMKIRKSQDWMIKYDNKEAEGSSKIIQEESLETYMEKKFPRYQSFTNWYFSVAFGKYLVDANGVALVWPTNLKETDGAYVNPDEYLKPYPTLFCSHQIYDYKEGEYYILKSDETNNYKTKGKEIEGAIFYYVDSEKIIELKEVDPKPVYEQKIYVHNLGYIPVVKLGGWVKKEKKYRTLYKSRISPMLPELIEAVREYSDLQAEVVQHIHSTLWTFEPQKCNVCSGAGKIGQKDGAPIACKHCKGKGHIQFNPFEHYFIPKPKTGETALPTPPIGYITKPIDIAKLQDARVQAHIFYALSAINFEFLDKNPLNESGLAKQIDRSEVDFFTHSVAEDIIKFIDENYKIACDYRYINLVPKQEERYKMLPAIPVPQKYDIFSEDFLVEEIKKLKEVGVDSSVITISTIDYINKKFGYDEAAKNYSTHCILLDPFASEKEEDITLKLSNGGVRKSDYIVHCNIKSFIKKALNENDDFYSWEYEDKVELMDKYAGEVIQSNSAGAKVISMIEEEEKPEDSKKAVNE